ncbi:hypothetical protein N7509_009314 [Penicillium cosmopolitanum]|uniref:AA1-like domain-containing protein n=1 Tax=Penicillium cosmopolitanum TaxID=1131564 RepID=A0A9W9VP66_9EURO|nr:uncharacterized protein N7509_009314 [Penicillium cosmopolitanum]KAJ5386773.1 hypothetical protein N7509_009314 [Penicillium cosmopolitanum]
MKFSEIITFSAALATSASASPAKPNVLSISHITSSTNGVTCTFEGVDNSVTSLSGAGSVDVGPPQTQVSGHCSKLWRRNAQPQRRNTVFVTFEGAADAEFSQHFPTDGTPTKIWNPLSISHIQINQAGVSCTFNGIDNSVTSLTGPATVDVGPPQTQIEGTCHA